MKRFLERHSDRITGTISGFDRVLFRGTLRSLSYCEALMRFLSIHSVLLKDFSDFAQQLSSNIKDHAKSFAESQGRPFIYLQSSSQSKEEIALQIINSDSVKQGLVCVLSCVEMCQSFAIRRDRLSKKLVLIPACRKCLHLYFYFLDPDFGLMHIRLQTWLPFTIQVCINGREWLARQMSKASIAYTQVDNCFTWIEDYCAAQRLSDSFTERKWERVLNAFAQRVNPLLSDGELNLQPYYWSIRQGEYATDILFRDEEVLTEIYPRLCRHAIEEFSSEDVMRFLSRRVNRRFNGEVSSDLSKRVEGIRVKHRVEENSIKMYDKAGSVLRVETTINNSDRFKVWRKATRRGRKVMAWMRMRKGIADMSRRAEVSRAANERYFEALSVVGEQKPSYKLLDSVSKRVEQEGKVYRALRPISPEDSKVLQIVVKGEFNLQGVRNGDLRKHLYRESEQDPVEGQKASSRVTRQLRLLRAHGLIYKVAKTNYYRITKKGHEVMTTVVKFRQSDVALLAA